MNVHTPAREMRRYGIPVLEVVEENDFEQTDACVEVDGSLAVQINSFDGSAHITRWVEEEGAMYYDHDFLPTVRAVIETLIGGYTFGKKAEKLEAK